MPTDKCVLVVGASGFVGSASVARFAQDGVRVIGLSRRPPSSAPAGVEHLALDLRDRDVRPKLRSLAGRVTHIVYAAVNETPGDLVAAWSDPCHAERNGLMFDNLLAGLVDDGSVLRHVTVVHGTKAYGVHRPDWHIAVPLRETLPRPDNDDFYFRQEDSLWAAAGAHGFGWTVLRAPIICGGGQGSNLNNLLAIAVFAALRRDAGLDLPFPGSWPSPGVTEMVDVELLAQAIDWAGESAAARNQIFNIANGDAFAWADLWPIVAEEMGLALGTPQRMSVRAYIDSELARWARLVERHDLVTDPHLAFLGESASLLDFAVNNLDRSVLLSTIKIRHAGFTGCIDTGDSILKWLRQWRAQRIIPPR